ncbi:TfoX/Sxy family protein [Chitinophaga agrisoli]|uniref:TfoX/Sxy family protein n=1 Tax=Chitinophaga agrisoli TaxID=2607653 RepID=A0A5B2VXP7_9BACT|nr:TfoX/Sxy family protein [Chitinophaga agrisoli]KAA2242936.1 TfoX/Sxy family protein [Chitinophaga agrisoli]
MPVNEQLANRVRELIAAAGQPVEEKKMFSGLTFMVHDKICVGVKKDSIMVRLDPAVFEDALEKEGCMPMVHNGKVMTGYVFIDESVLTTKKQLQYWVQLALDFNPSARSSKKK